MWGKAAFTLAHTSPLVAGVRICAQMLPSGSPLKPLGQEYAVATMAALAIYERQLRGEESDGPFQGLLMTSHRAGCHGPSMVRGHHAEFCRVPESGPFV